MEATCDVAKEQDVEWAALGGSLSMMSKGERIRHFVAWSDRSAHVTHFNQLNLNYEVLNDVLDL